MPNIDNRITANNINFRNAIEEAQSIQDVIDTIYEAWGKFTNGGFSGIEQREVIDQILAHLAGYDQDGYLTEKYMETRRKFVFGLVEKFITEGKSILFADDRHGQIIYDHKVLQFRNNLLATSPNVFDYIGGIEHSVDLLSLLEQCPALSDAFRVQLGNIVDQLSFTKNNSSVASRISEHFKTLSITEQIRVAGILKNISNYAASDMYDTTNVQDILLKVSEELDGLPVILDILVTSLADITSQRLEGYDDVEDEVSDLATGIKLEESVLSGIIKLKIGSLRPCKIAEGILGVRDHWDSVVGVIGERNRWDRLVGVTALDSNTLPKLSEDQNNAILLIQYLDFERTGDGSITLAVINWINDHFSKEFIKEYGLDSSIHAESQEGRMSLMAKLNDALPSARTVEAFETLKIEDYLLRKYPKATAEQIELLQLLHRPEIRSHIELSLGSFDITTLSIEAQLHLLEYMSRKKYEDYYRLTEAIDHYYIDKKLALESFLSLQFGEDYGDSLLTVIEKSTPEQSKEIITIIHEYRKISADFAKLFEFYSADLSKSIEVSINEKVTDILIAIEEIIQKGHIKVEVMSGVTADFNSIDEAIETMQDLLTALRQITNILKSNSVDTEIVKQSEEYVFYRISDKEYGNMLIYIRPRGGKVFDESVEYGRIGQGVEASVNFKINPLDPFAKLELAKDSGAVSIRLDREGITEGEPWNSPLRDPVREEGTISLDVSSQYGLEDTPEVRIGRLIAAGNKIRFNRGIIGAKDTLHHTSGHFEQSRFGTASGFADIANYIRMVTEQGLRYSASSRLSSFLVEHA